MKKLLFVFSLIFIFVGCSSVNEEAITKIEEERESLIQSRDELNLKLEEVNTKLTTSEEMVEVLKSEKSDLDTNVKELEDIVATLSSEIEDELEVLGPTPGLPLLLEATNVLQALMTEDFATVALYVTPGDGLRLSAYQYVDLSNDIVLSPSQVANWLSLPTTYTWGAYDGSGDPITKTADLYFYEFVSDEDYMLAPLVGNNLVLSNGNLINNIISEYIGTSLVEFYYPEFDPTYGGLDWKSLTLVMKNIAGEWYLVGIVHGQWTI